MRYLLQTLLLCTFAVMAVAEEPAPPPSDTLSMNNQRLQALIEEIAEDIEGRSGYWRFTLQDYPTSVITDEFRLGPGRALRHRQGNIVECLYPSAV